MTPTTALEQEEENWKALTSLATKGSAHERILAQRLINFWYCMSHFQKQIEELKRQIHQ